MTQKQPVTKCIEDGFGIFLRGEIRKCVADRVILDNLELSQPSESFQIIKHVAAAGIGR